MRNKTLATFILVLLTVGVAFGLTNLTYVAITNSTIDSTAIGSSTPSTGVFTTLKANTPATTDNSTNVATTAWVRNYSGMAEGAYFTTGFCTTGGAEQKCPAGPFTWPTAFPSGSVPAIACSYTGITGTGSNPGMYQIIVPTSTNNNVSFQITEQAGSNSAGGSNKPTGMYCIGTLQ